MLMYRKCHYCGDQLLNYGIFFVGCKEIVCSEACAEINIKYRGYSEFYRPSTFEECRDFGRKH